MCDPLSGVQTTSLQKYKKLYKLNDVAGGSKDELIPSVTKHFATQVGLGTLGKFRTQRMLSSRSSPGRVQALNYSIVSQVVDEEETLVVFAAVLRKQSVISKSNGIKKSQRAVQTKPKGR